MSPTKRQLEALRFISGFNQAKGYAPNLRCMATALGYASPSSAYYLLERLEERSLVRLVDDRIEVLADVPIPRSPTGEPLYFVPAKAMGAGTAETAQQAQGEARQRGAGGIRP